MKKLYFLFILCFLSIKITAQTTENFESESSGSTSFTDNGQVFTITSQARGPFDIQTAYPGTGWSGTANDNRYIDNDTFVGSNPQFTISSTPSFTLNNFWIYLANSSANVNTTGTLTITGKLMGATVYTASQTSPFNNTNIGTTNGFTQINLATFGSQNNSNKKIDQLVINTSGNFTYLALDAFNWTLGALGTEDFVKHYFSFYPNPSNKVLYFSIEEDLNIQIFNQTGQVIKEAKVTNSNNTINIEELSKGIYFVKSSDENSKIVKKLIIN